MRNKHLGHISTELDTDTGELTIKIADPDDPEKLLLDKTAKLSNNNPDKDIVVRFTFNNHPETGKDEKFKGILYSASRYLGWHILIYPQFGPGSITNDSLKVNTTGNHEFFTS